MDSPKPLSVVSSLQQSITSELPPSLSGTKDINLDVIDTPLINSDFAHCLSKSFFSDFGDSFPSIYTHDQVSHASTTISEFPAIPDYLEFVFYSPSVDAFISRSPTPPPPPEISDISDDDKNHDYSFNESWPLPPPPLQDI